MLPGDTLVLRWARNGAAVGAGFAVAGLLVPSEIGGYSPLTSFAAVLCDVVAVVMTVLVGALAGAALGVLAGHHRRRSGHHQPR